MLSVGSWWMSYDEGCGRREGQGFGERLDERVNIRWEQDHGDADFLRSQFLRDPARDEEVDMVDFMYAATHGSYTAGDPATYGRGFLCWDGSIRYTDDLDWGNLDLEYFSSCACRLLYHSSTNSVGRWASAFGKLHYMFGFHNDSTCGGDSEERGRKFGKYSSRHFDGFSERTLRRSWKKACVETESNSVEWAYLRANGETSSGVWVDTQNEVLPRSEPRDPIRAREFWTVRSEC